jgi:hypothetical protein
MMTVVEMVLRMEAAVAAALRFGHCVPLKLKTKTEDGAQKRRQLQRRGHDERS